MYVDWSFPEKSEGIGRRRGGWGGGGHVANPFHGGGKDIFFNKLAA